MHSETPAKLERLRAEETQFSLKTEERSSIGLVAPVESSIAVTFMLRHATGRDQALQAPQIQADLVVVQYQCTGTGTGTTLLDQALHRKTFISNFFPLDV